jgi:hypothetical protein
VVGCTAVDDHPPKLDYAYPRDLANARWRGKPLQERGWYFHLALVLGIVLAGYGLIALCLLFLLHLTD